MNQLLSSFIKLFILFNLISQSLLAQLKFSKRIEYIAAIGTSSFLGDLGGADQIGTNKLKDLNPSTTSFAMSGGIRYKKNPEFAIKSILTFAWVNGSDKKTNEPFRNNRNLTFSSPIVELSIHGEYYLTKQKNGNIYKTSKISGKRIKNTLLYVFAGAGFFWYHPMAKVNGNWYNLRKIGTEGQNLVGGPKKYSGFSISLPIGFGFKYPISRRFSIGAEFGPRFTFTDYIDDVSGVYANNDAIKNSNGEMASYLADPNLGFYRNQWDSNISVKKRTAAGLQRGNKKNNDTYTFFQVCFTFRYDYFAFSF
jgi:Domain of unknown function (DUF6089)